MDTLLDKIFSWKVSDSSFFKKFSGSQNFLRNNSLLQDIPLVYQQELFGNSLYSLDFNLPSETEDTKLNFLSQFHALQIPSKIPKLQPFSPLMQDYIFSNSMRMVREKNTDFFCSVIPYIFDKDRNNCVKTESLIEIVSPISNKILNIQSNLAPDTVPEKAKNLESNCKRMEGELNKQLVNRKAKELKKRSKKRRKRQKKAEISTKPNLVTNHKLTVHCEKIMNPLPKISVSPSPDMKKNCDILCDVTISPDAKSVQITVPHLSSFLVTVESGEDDSDWDTINSDNDQDVIDDTEFQFCGLFVSALTAANSIVNSVFVPEKKITDIEDPVKTRLREVNKKWRKSVRDLDEKKKSVSLVSFAPDDELVEIFSVEMCERQGEWERYARDRDRFQNRIQELDKILSPCFSTNHRAKIYYNINQIVL